MCVHAYLKCMYLPLLPVKFNAILYFQLSFHLFLPGLYNISVFAKNSISKQNASMIVESCYPVLKIDLYTIYGVANKSVQIPFYVYGGIYIAAEVNFGDGEEKTFTVDDVQRMPNYQYYQPSEPGEVPGHDIVMSYLYSVPGQYELEMLVYNDVSSVKRKTTVMIDEAITGFRIETNSSRVISLDESVTVTAHVDTGNNITFIWKHSSDCYIVNLIR